MEKNLSKSGQEIMRNDACPCFSGRKSILAIEPICWFCKYAGFDLKSDKLPDKTDDAPAAGIKIPGYPSITLPKDQKTVNVALLNPEGNPCYFTFEIVLKDTGESLYKSKLVPPGKAINEITMSRALSAGEYDATIKITTTSVADGSAMNGANVETVLIVK